jgi:hypothetical protein
MARALAPDGTLFLGAAETALGLCEALVLADGARTSAYVRR